MDDTKEPIDELIDRLESAEETLVSMAEAKRELGHESDHDRLRGKVAGVRLALSYAREISIATS